MSSLANAIKRKTHKERSQPASREKYGLLEKRKDYLLRARDFHRKERTLKQLQRKAEERNPDEFYHAMERQRTRGGVHQASSAGGGGGGAGGGGANKYSQEELALMRTQDVGYVGSRARAEASRIERLRASLHFVGATDGLGGGDGDDEDDGDDDESDDDDGQGGLGRRPLKRARHTVFVDSSAEAAAFSPEDFFDTPGELLGRAHNRPRRAQMRLLSGGGGGGAAAAAARSGGGGGGGGPGAANGSGAPTPAARAAPVGVESEDAERLRRAAEAAAKHERALLLAASAASADAGGGKSGERGKSGGKNGSVRTLERARAASYAELAQREDRARKLRRVEEHLGLARLMAGARGKGPGGRTRKLRREQMQPGTPANVKVFKWRRERRR